MKRFTLLLLFGTTILFFGCIKSEENEFEDINSWIRDNMEETYLWNERVPAKVNGSIPPVAFFGSMLNPEDDISFIVRNGQALLNDVEGFTFSSGISPSFGQFSNGGVFIIVEFVYPGTPAALSGIKRGDIILEVNDTPLNTLNFLNLFYSETSSVKYALGNYNSETKTISYLDSTVTVEQDELELNPVIYSDVIEEGNSKIGYIMYSDFKSGTSGRFNDSLDLALQDIKAEGVTDLIVDLRYNTGGDFEAAKNFANALVPQSVAQNEEVFVKFRYNDILQQQIIQEEGENSENLIIKFEIDPENLDMNKIYFLTTSKTSSTSELLINGLNPHMEVVQIGSATAGEYFETRILLGSDATPPNSYAMVPIVLQYENSEGTTGFDSGLQPDFPVVDNLLNVEAVGDVEDPLISRAIDDIRNSTSSASNKIFTKPYKDLVDKRKKRLGRIMFPPERKN